MEWDLVLKIFGTQLGKDWAKQSWHCSELYFEHGIGLGTSQSHFQPQCFNGFPLVRGSDVCGIVYCLLQKTCKREMALDNDTSRLGFSSQANGRKSWCKNLSLPSLHRGMSCVGQSCTDGLVHVFHHKTDGCVLSSSSMARGEGCTLEDQPPLVFLYFVSQPRHQTPTQCQALFLPPKSTWDLSASITKSLRGAWGWMWSGSLAKQLGGGINCTLK